MRSPIHCGDVACLQQRVALWFAAPSFQIQMMELSSRKKKFSACMLTWDTVDTGTKTDQASLARLHRSFRPWSFAAPHHRAFQLVWLSWLSCQIAVFTPAALAPIIRDDLGATQHQMSASGIAAIAGSLLSRIFMGTIVDPTSLGPRRALPCFLLLIAPSVFCMAFVTTPEAFIVVRFFIGFSLGAFVVTQYTSASMFNVQIVGMTNAAAAGEWILRQQVP